MISNESKANRYWKYLEDWSSSWGRLVEADLIDGDDGGYWLTERGRPLAEQYYAQRPDHYWYYYQHYYPEAQASKAHSELCRRVFGKDLTQDGQVDMDTLHDMMSQPIAAVRVIREPRHGWIFAPKGCYHFGVWPMGVNNDH